MRLGSAPYAGSKGTIGSLSISNGNYLGTI
jgi:hypothetical protein